MIMSKLNSLKFVLRFRFVIVGMFLLFPLACHSGGTAVTPIPDQSFTVTPFPPTRTQFPTPGVTFAPTSTTSQFPEPTPTLEPSPTSTPTGDDVLPVITNSTWRSNRTPTPIAAPKLGSENYRLKNWTEADALELIRTLEEYAHKNDIEGGSHSRPNLPKDYQLVELAIREMLFRFPDTRYQETLNWRLALANSLQGETDLDDWVLSRIESYINQDHIKLDDLNAMLMTRGFAVAEETPASNLFGDGGESYVYRVQPVDSFGDRGMVFALRKQNQNKAYEVVHIYSDDLDGVIGAGDRIVDIADHNQNGIPEVVFETSASSGSNCYSKVFIFEWRDGRFVDLTQGKISSDCDSWRFSEPDSAGIDTVTAQKFNISLSSEYIWNGIYYELSELNYIGEPGQCSVYIY